MQKYIAESLGNIEPAPQGVILIDLRNIGELEIFLIPQPLSQS